MSQQKRTWIGVFTVGDRKLRVDKDRIVIGSVISADVRLTGDAISPIHAVVELVPTPTIYDIASETGVYVNGTKTVVVPLKAGDKIRIGNEQFTFETADRAETQAAMPAASMSQAGGRTLYQSPGEDMGAFLVEDGTQMEDIFDYSASQQRALEVVLSWYGTILDVEHFVQEQAVTVGGTDSDDFGIPSLLASHYPIVSQGAGGYVLNIDPQMKGVIQRQGSLKSFDELRPAGQGTFAVPLGQGDFAKVTVGTVDFYLSYTAAPPRLKRSRVLEKDPFFFKIFATSLVMTVLMVVTMFMIDVPPMLDTEEVPERIATILYQPEKYVSRPKPPPAPIPKSQPDTQPEKPPAPVVKKVEKAKIDLTKPVPSSQQTTQAQQKGGGVSRQQDVAKEGAGARAKGTEGSRGSKKAAPGNTKQDQAFRPSPVGGVGRGGGDSQITDQGNLDLLKGATGKIQDLLGNSAAKLGKGGDKLKGFGGFTTQGNGGLALAGRGSGGGGDADSLGGLSDQGRGGGRVGTGQGAAGDGSGIVGGKTRVQLRTGGPEESVVMGAIDADAVKAAILAHRDAFRLCYEKELNAQGGKAAVGAGGSVITSFEIGSSGKVTQAGVDAGASTLKDENVRRCVITVLRRIDFPIPQGAGSVEVRFPFKYAAIGG